ncbi:serine hydrolase domain-containing protein [Undibacterium umbellatum]|uniref:Serine hydrolase n=1 Tax=Undibacterium umbellatum TaxID=2762300 RepID=A0ABR6Z618_9BURK|nr:serine hydrolase [Undibacterium umbellatum]MBC3907221.1 serine hydrolase [Undibacterium umbellatum]
MKYFPASYLLMLMSLMANLVMAQGKAANERQVTQQLAAIAARPDKTLASLSVLAIKSGKVVYQQQFGQRYFDQKNPANNLPADTQTLYRVASVSKMVAAIAAMCLVEQGKLDLEADISSYLGFQIRNPHYPDRVITTRMLLSHISSLRDDGGYNFPADVSMQSFLQTGGKNYSQGLQWADPAKAKPGENFAPGAYFHYVNLNWGVLGTVMEAVSGQRFDLLMQELVLQPLQIEGAYHPELLSTDALSRLSVLYRKQANEVWNAQGPWVAQTDDFRNKPLIRRELQNYRPGTNATLFSPQGGLRISMQGLSRIMLMLMNEGELDGVRLLKPASVRALIAEQWRYDASTHNGDDYRGLFLSWGLGFQRFTDTSAAHYGDRLVQSQPSFKPVGHLGFAYGLQSAFLFDPTTRNGIIYVIGGVAADPDKNPGAYSSMSIWEEQILTAIYKLF